MASSRAARSERRPISEPEPRDAVPDLLAPGGPFAEFPGAVLLAGRDGRVLGANDAARPLAKLVEDGAVAEVESAVAAGLQGKTAQVNPVLLGGAENGEANGQAFDLAVLPWSHDAALLLARDITLERSLRAALIESRQRYKDLVEASSDFAWETDTEGRFTFVSPRGALGYAAAQLVGQRGEDFIVGSEDDDHGSPFTTRVPLERAEFWFRAADGDSACLSAVALPLLGAGGAWHGARGVCREITRERAREAELARARHREALLGYILRMVRDEPEPVSMLKAAAGALLPALSARGVVIYRRDSADRLTRAAQAGRAPPPQAVKPLLAQVSSGVDEILEPCADGQLFVKATRYHLDWNGALCLWRDAEADRNDEENRFLLGEIVAQIGVANQQLVRERELEKRSSTDALTGLLNRRGFLERMELRFARAAGRERGGALFYFDLDNFKPVNDTRGHEAGDRVLIELAGLLKKRIRKADLAARLGGDEFAVFLESADPDAAMEKAEALRRAAAEMLGPLAVSDDTPLGLSIGVAVSDARDREEVSELLARADRAMYAAKRRGKGRVVLAPPPAEEPAA